MSTTTDTLAVPPSEEVKSKATKAVSPAPVSQPNLYRTVWRWHFYAGILVTPVLLVMAITGGLYVFKEELESYFYADVVVAEQRGERVPMQEQLVTAENAVSGMKAKGFAVRNDPGKATEVRFFNKERNLRVFVNPYTGEYQGTIDRNADFFPVVLKIHRNLFAGTCGRVLTELTTSWGIILFITGVFLWWPRRSQKWLGVWWPRVQGKTYTVLRDWHTVPGFYFVVFALLIAITGLFFSQVWGRAYVWTASTTGQIPASILKRPLSESSPKARPITTDQAQAIAQEHYPGCDLGVFLPQKPNDSYGVFVLGERVTIQGFLVIDQYTGAVKENIPWNQFPPMFQARTFAYTIHVGSIFGMPTKILALTTCVVILAMSITGVWMWLQRRPRGRTGFPRHTPDMRVPWWLMGVIVGICLVLPVAGLSLLLILGVDWCVRRIRRRVAVVHSGQASAGPST